MVTRLGQPYRRQDQGVFRLRQWLAGKDKWFGAQRIVHAVNDELVLSRMPVQAGDLAFARRPEGGLVLLWIAACFGTQRINEMLAPKPIVHFVKHVSDNDLRLVLNEIALTLGTNVIVHSGDRDYRPKGSPSHSLHLSHRAADLHAPGMTDDFLFARLQAAKSKIFHSATNSYQVIHHGKFSETEGEHVHIGHYQLIKSFVTGPGVSFWVEGIFPGGKGRYTLVH